MTGLLLLISLLAYCRAIDYIHDAVQYQAIATDTGAYHFGYNTGVLGAHSFHEEWRDENGEVHGRYGLTDPNGYLRIVTYTAGRDGYRAVQTIQPGNGVEPRQRPPPGSGHVLVTPGSKSDEGATFIPGRYQPTTPAPATDAEDIDNYRNALGDYHSDDVIRPGGVVGASTPKRSIRPRFPFVLDQRQNDIEGLPVFYHKGVPYRPTVYRNGVPYTGAVDGRFLPGNLPPDFFSNRFPLASRLSRSAESSSKSTLKTKEESAQKA